MNRNRYPVPTFDQPIPDRFVYAGWSVDVPRLPRVGASRRRHEFVARLSALADRCEQDPQIAGIRVFETRVIAPVPGTPRLDVLILGRARTASGAERFAEAVQAEQPRLLVHTRNTHRFGDTEGPGTGTFLFNHFTAPDSVDPVVAWERAAAWYVHEMGVDNTTLLQPDPEVDQSTPYPLINYVQAPCAPATFLRRQLTRPSFHTDVRRLLREHRMTSLPLLARLVRVPPALTASEAPAREDGR